MVRPEPRSAAAAAVVAAALLAATISLAVTAVLRPAAATALRPAARAARAAPAASSARLEDQSSWQRCAVPAHLAKGQIVVPIVVDFGGRDAKVLVTCIVTRPGDTGAQVLQAQAPLLGYSVPRYDASGSGLLCAIDGYPASECGTESGNHYAYWAYWHGGGKRWQYASDGPGEWTVSKGDVEGWRFEPDGSATPADPPPRAPSNPTELEMPATTMGTATATTRPPGTAGKSSSSSRSNAGGGGKGNTTLGANAAGPVRQSADSRSGTRTRKGLVILCVALIVLIGAGAYGRSRRKSSHAS